jgi:uncharacterized HAD superfamily protein
MKLEKIFKEQKAFLKNFIDPDNLSEEDKIKYTKEYILSIHRELGEILDTIPWKLHRKKEILKSDANTAEEIIDCFKFLLNLCLIWKIDDEKFFKEFERKSMVVWQRYNQEILKVISKNDKVCAIDLDDTLADSDEHFTNVYNEKNDTLFVNRSSIKKALDVLEYEDFKSWYRESGEKVNIPVKNDAINLCEYLKNEGYKIVIISARPYDKHNRIFSDTLQWLNNNQIPYDAVYFEKDKHIKILKELPHLSFIIEDDFECAKQISDLGYQVYLLQESIDENKVENKNITTVNNLREIYEYLSEKTK